MATTMRPIRGWFANASSVCPITGLPPIDRYCFGPSARAPARSPRPAATITTAISPSLTTRPSLNLHHRGRIGGRRRKRQSPASISQLHNDGNVVRLCAFNRSARILCMHGAPILDRPLTIGRVTVGNRVFLAPMSGITDEAFRARAVRHGAGLVVSEMVASAELAKGREKSALRIRRPDVPVHVVQLAGRNPHWMAEGARIAVDGGADVIDINMGCPAKKVTGGYCGSALMREPDHALALIEAVVAAVSVPVTVKMRLGWDETALNAPDIARRAENAGVQMITVHGRTRCQFYQGRADRRAIRRIKEAVSIPVVANGDVSSLADAVDMLEQSGADAVMIGREHYGRPWLAGQIAAQARAVSVDGVPVTPAD